MSRNDLNTAGHLNTLLLNLRSLLPQPSGAAREPLTKRTFLRLVLPVLLAYYGTAILVLLPRTLTLRMALLPASLWLAYKAGTKIDMTLRYNEPRLNYMNQALIVIVTAIAMRIIDWTFQPSPIRRIQVDSYQITPESTPTTRIPIETQPRREVDLLRDSLDLAFNLRGLGWSWSGRIYIPPTPWAQSTSRSLFAAATLGRSVMYFAIFDSIQYAIQAMSPSLNTPDGASIFDPTLPALERHMKACATTILTGFVIYRGLQAVYCIAASIGVLIFCQSPSQWPPLFDQPWKATSLADFCGRRWHQVFRRCFVAIGKQPFRRVFHRAGGVMGAFLLSALLHDWATWAMGRGGEFRSVGGFFLMMGVGIILEELWRKFTHHAVRGWLGWIWTMTWVGGWGTMLVDAWFRRGLIASVFVPESWRPSRFLLAWI